MAKKTKAKDTNVNIDELVNEGKYLNEAEVNETLKQIVEETKAAAPNGFRLDENVSSQYEAEAEVKETEDTKMNEETVETVQNTETKVEETSNDIGEKEENIDDVIAECTGEAEEKKKVIKDNEPWYVARAKRCNDYYNW